MSTVLKPENRAEWLEARRNYITGSDVAALFGLSPFKTALQVYREKVGEDDGEVQPTAPMLRGTYLEPIAADLYVQRTGRSVRRQPFRVHREYPFLAGTVDRQVLRGADVKAPGVLEIKTPGWRNFSKIQREGLPDYAMLQLQTYLAVYGYGWGSFAVFNAEQWALAHFDIEADEAVQRRIIEVAGDFWETHVLRRVPPKEDATVPEVQLPEVAGSLVRRDDPEWAAAARDLIEAKEVKAEAEALYEAAKERLIDLAGGLGTFEGAGLRVYHRQMPGRASFDRKALERAQPLDPAKVYDFVRERLNEEAADYLVNAALLDLSQFEKVGKPYTEFRPYVLRSASEEW